MTADTTRVAASWIADAVSALLEDAGLAAAEAGVVAGALAEADLRGVHSHGAALAPMYRDRLVGGSVSRRPGPEVVSRTAGVIVLDAYHCFGQLSGDAAMSLAVEAARETGVAVATVRHAFHFGEAGRYVRAAASAGLIGVAASNTRPLIGVEGGRGAIVGNNPLAIGIPRRSQASFVLDIAMSAAAMGRIRGAAEEGSPIPESWALDEDGRPTGDAAAALRGSLQAFGGHKGLGLALALEALTGGLSGGAMGAQVRGLYADPAVPYDCSQFFVAIDPAAFGEPEAVLDHLDGFFSAIDARLPGSRSEAAYERARRDGVDLPTRTLEALETAASGRGLTLPTRHPPITTHQEGNDHAR